METDLDIVTVMQLSILGDLDHYKDILNSVFILDDHNDRIYK